MVSLLVTVVASLVAAAGVTAGAAALRYPRRVIRFRSPGRIQAGSISDAHATAWRGIGAAVAALSLAFFVAVLVL